MAAPISQPTEIEPGLWQSMWPEAGLCARLGIATAVNLVPADQPHGLRKGPGPDPDYGTGVTVLHFPFLDMPGTRPPLDWLDQVSRAIVAAERPVLVHCIWGNNRSTIAVGAALVRLHGLTGTQALAAIKAKRAVNPDRNWSTGLEEWRCPA
ncbi:MAG: protein-tyrosine phosphatase family protein [Steroidobacteraceae bacterium]